MMLDFPKYDNFVDTLYSLSSRHKDAKIFRLVNKMSVGIKRDMHIFKFHIFSPRMHFKFDVKITPDMSTKMLTPIMYTDCVAQYFHDSINNRKDLVNMVNNSTNPHAYRGTLKTVESLFYFIEHFKEYE